MQAAGASRSATLREQIEEEIATRRLLPGERLDEQVLAARFKVSRTPVREALLQLAAAGLLQLRPRRGAIVREVTSHSLIEMFELMGELEALCARLAARRMAASERDALLVAHARCREAHAVGDPDRYYYLNEEFHHLIYRGSHNAFLIEQTEGVHRRLKAYRRLQLRAPHRMSSSFREHQAVVDAILAGDSEQAASVMRGHIVIQGARFDDLMGVLGQLERS
jgi:DNA-binding GntR family transcriptional regulator